MAKVTNLRNGSSGADVKKMQEALVKAGYDVGKTGADGVFGKNTLAAVKQFQKDNGLSVDGIAGKNTLGKLYGNATSSNALKAVAANNTANAAEPKAKAVTPATTTQTNTTATATETPTTSAAPVTSPAGFTYGDFSYADFAASDMVNQAHSLLQQQEANKPGAYTPIWQDEADAYLSQYQNRDPFSYDFNSDALYQQYKDAYINQGRMAMMDTMGQAAALTGGYGNSYAQTAGQQAYNQQLGQLNEIVPELWQMAQDRYTLEGQNMLDMYDLYMNREAQEYGKYQDNLDNWYQELARLQDNYNTLYNREYDAYLEGKNTAYNEYLTDRSEKYDAYQKEIDREYQKERDAIADEQWLKQYELSKSNRYRGGTGDDGNDDPTYVRMSDEQWTYYEKKLERANNLEDVRDIAKEMAARNFEPSEIEAITAPYKRKFETPPPPPQPQPTTNYISGTGSSGGGGGGGRYVIVAK